MEQGKQVLDMDCFASLTKTQSECFAASRHCEDARRSHLVQILLFFILFLMTSSCASRKKTIAPVPVKSYQWLTSKVDLDVEGNGMTFDDLSGQLRMRRDSILWLCVTAPMGVEVARIKVSTDSVWVINRMEKTYLTEPLDSVAQHFGIPISLPWIETLLLDNNEGIPPVENQIVLLKIFAFGNYSAKVKYSKVQLDEETSFPLKITDKMERILLPKKR
jgi:hypothetical protein